MASLARMVKSNKAAIPDMLVSFEEWFIMLAVRTSRIVKGDVDISCLGWMVYKSVAQIYPGFYFLFFFS